MKALSLGALFTMALLTHTPLMGGVITGTLRLPVLAPASQAGINAYPGRAHSMPGPHGRQPVSVADAVVHVDQVPAEAESLLASAAKDRPRLAQANQSFVPRVLAIAVGSKVDFPNQDPIYHNVFSLSPTKRFDLGKYPRGGSRQVLFNKPGLVNVYCDIHSDMEAFVLVLPHHGFTRPAPTGEFRLPDLPAGRYTLRAWHPDFGERTLKVDVPAAGMVAADLSF